jgi:[acyl-carrier-protein] S-malonyltransferase
MFAGQGAQVVGMGRDLVEASPAARRVFEQADAALGRSIGQICFEGPADVLTESVNCQPAIYTMSLACLAAFQEKTACQPVVAGGLSLGEFAALTAAGVLDAAAGIRLVAERGRLMQEACRASEGGMAAVLKGDNAVIAAVCAAHGIDVANYNCPGQVVISGTKPGIAAASAELATKGMRVMPLTVDGAFHSRLMQPAADRFVPVLAATVLSAPRLPVTQNVVGAVVTDVEQVRINLARQVSGSVRWEECVRAMLAVGVDALIEFGPGKVLCGFAQRIDKSVPVCNISSAADVAAACEFLSK